MIQYIDGKLLKDMFISGANNLQNNKNLVDKLNVFPVPDGDTGTNMSLTISYAIKELSKVNNDNIADIGKAMSKGSLMGARGNSGVILSQIIRGFAKSVEGKDTLTSMDLAMAFKEGSDTAYKAVIKPIEGTILTVVRESSDYGVKIAKKEKDIQRFLESFIKEANASLKRTPDLLINLKEAGVVDSGGKGLVCVYEGMYSALLGNIIELKEVDDTITTQQEYKLDSHENINFAYCTEFILESDKLDYEGMREIIEKYGDSLVVVGDEGIIKVHIHTNDPGLVLQEGLKYGQLVTIKIENMKIQHENIIAEDTKPPKKYGLIATSMGEGLAKIFKDFGVDQIIEGGQTMNPSTEDFMKAINDVNAENVFILPNNSNIIMAANQAKALSDKNIVVLPTKTTPQGFAALLGFNLDSSVEENEETMLECLQNVKSGQVTYAVRDTVMNDIDIKEGDIIGIGESKMLTSGKEKSNVTISLIDKLIDEDSAIITLLYGEEISEEEANDLKDMVEEKYPDLEIELYYGGQPVYYYLVSVE